MLLLLGQKKTFLMTLKIIHIWQPSRNRLLYHRVLHISYLITLMHQLWLMNILITRFLPKDFIMLWISIQVPLAAEHLLLMTIIIQRNCCISAIVLFVFLMLRTRLRSILRLLQNGMTQMTIFGRQPEIIIAGIWTVMWRHQLAV